MPWKYAIHDDPVWRKQANFIINAPIEQGRWEQLWTRKIDENHVQICCIPFFVYDLALGDEVEIGPEYDKQYVFQRVTKPSGRYPFRVWFGESHDVDTRDEMVNKVAELGCLIEWFSVHLGAIDAPHQEVAQELADYLHELQNEGALEYETGLTHERPDSSEPTPM